MNFTIQVLNSDAVLNNFSVIGALDFIPGEEKDLVLRVIDAQKNIRYILPNTTIITATFNKTDGTTFTKNLTMFADDRSILETTLEESDTEDLASGTITIDFDINGDASTIWKAILRGGLRRTTLTGC